jgi:hypothetical protein
MYLRTSNREVFSFSLSIRQDFISLRVASARIPDEVHTSPVAKHLGQSCVFLALWMRSHVA